MRATLARLAGPGVIAGAAGASAARLMLPAGTGEALAAWALPVMGLVALASALAATRAAGRIPEQALIGAAAVCAGAGMWLAASDPGGGAGMAGLAVAAAGFGPSIALQRLLIAESAEVLSSRRPWPERDAEGNEARFVLFGWYWAALTLGVLGILLASMVQPIGITAVLRGAGAAAAAGGLLTFLRPLPGGDPAPDGIAAPDAPWSRRAAAAAFGFGALFAGTASAGHELLAGEWQRTPHGAAGVLAATTAGAAVTVTLGRWFHRLGRRRGARRAAAAGHQLMLGGGMALLGAFSFTYIGLIVSWILAAGSLVLAAVGLDAATWAGFRPVTRRLVAARQVAGFASGAAVTAALLAGPLSGRDQQLKIAVPSVACIVAGYLLARRCPAEGAAGHRRGAWSATVPGRVEQGPGTPLLRLAGVGVAYDGIQVVFGAELEVHEGSIVALLGTNGAGKTTTLRAISGLEGVCAGRIQYRGLDITRTPPTWRVGMGLHQIVGGGAVAGELSVAENLRLFAHSVPRSEVTPGIAAALEQFPRLAERRSQSAATLSGGEKQMLALAKAFIASPKLLLIDEFSLGLAPALVDELLPALRGIAARGTAILLVEQSLDLACELADYVYVMEKGEIRLQGTPAELQAQGDLVRSVYLAEPPMSAVT